MPNTNVIYQYKWKGLKTQWEYVLEFIPPDTTNLNNPTIIELPSGTLVNLRYSYKYDRFPLGMPEAPALNIELSLLEIPNTDDYIEFKKAILNPAMYYDWTFWFGDKYRKFEFVLGTLVNLNIKPLGQSQYFTVFVGVVKNVDKLKYDLNQKKVTLEATNLIKHVLESFDFTALEMFSDFEQQNGDTYVESSNIVEYYVDGQELVQHSSSGHKFRLRPISFLFKYLKEIGNTIVSKVSRGQITQIAFTSEFPIFLMYEQKFDKSGDKGNQILDPNIIIQLVRTVNSNEYITIDGIAKAFEETYKNSVWDFVREYSEWMLSCGFVFNNICAFSYLLGDDNFFIDVQKRDIQKIDIEINKNRVKTVTASTYEHHSDDKYGDITDYTATKRGTLNEDEISVPMVFNNSPSAVSYVFEGGLFGGPSIITKRAFFPHIRGLYSSIFRIHEYCEYYIKSNFLSSSWQSCSFSPFNYNQLPFKNIESMFVALQSTNCMHKWSSQALSEVFSQIQQSYISITVSLEDVSLWQIGPLWMFTSKLPWLIPLCNINFDITSIDNNIPSINKWKVIEATTDFKTETTDFKLLSILV